MGFHIPLAKGWKKAITYAESLGCECIQVFPHNPRSWEITSKDTFPVREALLSRGIRPLIIHASYLVNLASARFGERSLKLLKEEIRRGKEWGAEFLVFHAGSGDIEVLRENLKKLRDDKRIKLLVENTAGGGKRVGRFVEEIEYLLNTFPSLGFCLDTAHAFQAGYDLSSPRGVKDFFQKIEKSIGLEKVKLLHFNDSLTPSASFLDRHAHLGEGYIGGRGLREILCYFLGRNIPVIMETPGIGTSWDRSNMGYIRELLKEIEFSGKIKP